MRSLSSLVTIITFVLTQADMLVGQVVEPGNRISIDVHSRCVSHSGDSSIVFEYDVTNRSSSFQPVWVFSLLAKSPKESVNSCSVIPGWFHPDVYGSERSPVEVNVRWHFDSDTSSGGILPGASENRFSFTTKYLPGIGNYYAEGYHHPPSFPEGMAEDSIPGYDDLTPYGPGIVGRTVVPVLQKDSVSCFRLLDSIDSYIVQSRRYGWITSQSVASKYSEFVARTRNAIFFSHDPRMARQILDSLLTSISVDSVQVTLTSDACALIRINASCTASKLSP